VAELAYRVEEPAGYVFAEEQPGTVPLHRLVREE
jgi:hypothetical protein